MHQQVKRNTKWSVGGHTTYAKYNLGIPPEAKTTHCAPGSDINSYVAVPYCDIKSSLSQWLEFAKYAVNVWKSNFVLVTSF